MRRTYLAIAIAVAFPFGAYANNYAIQSPGSTQALGAGAPASAASSRAAANATSFSSSASRATGGNAAGGSGYGGNGGAGGSSNVIVNGAGGGSGGNRLVTSAIAPEITAFNPCSAPGNSAALQTGIFGVSVGKSAGFDEACRLHQLGKDKAAVAYLCRMNDDIRQAFKDIGEPCPQDSGKPTVQPVSTVSTTQVVTVNRDDVPDWCGTTTGRDPSAARAKCLAALNAATNHLRDRH